MEEFNEGGYDAVFLIYNEFKSAISQTVAYEQLLPVDVSKSHMSGEAGQSSFAADMIFEPSPEQIIDELLNKHFAIQVYRAMCESVAANTEHVWPRWKTRLRTRAK